jgi:lipopolysaccharide export system protein LptA
MVTYAMTRLLTAATALTLVAVAGFLSGAGTARADALGVIGGEHLDIAAERLEVDVRSGKALLEGEVRATLGELSVSCSRVEITYDESPRVRRARGTGEVRARFKGIVAHAASIDVDVPRRKVELSGGVRLERGKGWVTADRALLDVQAGKVSLESVKGAIPVAVPD